jgi:2-Cys peroxiredoxin 5
MKAWGKILDPSDSSGVSVLPCLVPQCFSIAHDLRSDQIRFLGDPSVEFTKALDLSFDGASIFGGDRSKRYALVIENGAVKEAHVESDNTGLNGMLSSMGLYGKN